LNLALALAERGAPVGLLDADLYGPNIPRMVGLTRTEWSGDWTVARRGKQASMTPIERYGINIMSAGFLLGEDQPMVLDALTMHMLLTQLLRHVAWGHLEYLLVDLPPGTADLQQHMLRDFVLSGAILVVTPQEVAHLDGKKALQHYRRAGIPILGGIENMSSFLCPHCGEPTDLFARVAPSRSIWEMGVEKLGAIPWDVSICRAGDTGRPLMIAEPEGLQAASFRQMAEHLAERLESAGA
jgi:ATP-binding protein involved in chromosome partitioning